jgi:acyl carrier protein
MTKDEIRGIVLRVLGQIAPEADLSNLKPDLRIRDQLDIDSMDLLNVVIALHKELNVEIPEADYSKLATLDGCIAYLEGLLGSRCTMRLESRWFRTSKIKEELSQARTGSERDSLAQSESSAKRATQSRFYTPIFGLNTCGRGQKGRLRHKRRHKTNGNRHSLSASE